LEYVYLIRSISKPSEYHTGVTDSVQERLAEHNARKSPHTAKFAPREVVVYIALSNDKNAFEFERYQKSGSGQAFSNKHFRDY